MWWKDVEKAAVLPGDHHHWRLRDSPCGAHGENLPPHRAAGAPGAPREKTGNKYGRGNRCQAERERVIYASLGSCIHVYLYFLLAILLSVADVSHCAVVCQLKHLMLSSNTCIPTLVPTQNCLWRTRCTPGPSNTVLDLLRFLSCGWNTPHILSTSGSTVTFQ